MHRAPTKRAPAFERRCVSSSIRTTSRLDMTAFISSQTSAANPSARPRSLPPSGPSAPSMARERSLESLGSRSLRASRTDRTRLASSPSELETVCQATGRSCAQWRSMTVFPEPTPATIVVSRCVRPVSSRSSSRTRLRLEGRAWWRLFDGSEVNASLGRAWLSHYVAGCSAAVESIR